MAEFLFEIGLEEIPARMIAAAQAELARRVVAMLERERLRADSLRSMQRTEDDGARGEAAALAAELIPNFSVQSFSTPRRLAVIVQGVLDRQQDVAEEVLGPSTKIAYKEGVPTPAAVAFAKKAGVAVEALKTVSTPKGEYLQATSVKAGWAAAEVIAAELPKELAAIYWPKNMYWRAGKPERFVRPVRWLLALLDGDVVPVEFAGYTGGRETFGHRVLYGAAPVPVNEPGEYAEVLRAAFVEPEVEARRHTIRKALDRVCRTLPNTRWREDHALVDKLTHLTEWPTVIAGGFEPEYLALPEEVLVTVMRDHQSYFAVEDKQGKLAPHFLAVLNTQADAAGEAVIRHGNERVLRARFNDARFFWEFDQRVSLKERVDLLAKVTFQKELGSYAAKADRMGALAIGLGHRVVRRGVQVDVQALEQAAVLCKTDLTCELVKEFTELQGTIGGLYARAQGLSEPVSAAIYDHYRPQSMDDSVPATVEGAILALADKADTVAAMFSIGLEPTGSKDPFALRRAANGVVKILAESEPAIPLGLDEVAQAACGVSADGTAGEASKVAAFFGERLEFYLREALGQAYDVVKAVLAVGRDDVRDTVARAEAVSSMRGSADFAAVSGAFKRMKNILSQAAEKGSVAAGEVVAALLADPAERVLADRAGALRGVLSGFCEAGDYVGGLAAIATLRPEVDAFFDAVMVMAPEAELRANRLALLTDVLSVVSGIVDFSEIVVAA